MVVVIIILASLIVILYYLFFRKKPVAQVHVDTLENKIQETLEFVEQKIVIEQNTREWNVYVPHVADLEPYTDENYYKYSDDKAVLKQKIGEIACGEKDLHDISFRQRNLELTWKSNKKKSTIQVIEYGFKKEGDDWILQKGHGTIGTSHCILKDDYSTYLLNVYVTQHHNSIVTRCSGINTPQKVKQFDVLLNSLVNKDYKRVCSLSLVCTNSFAVTEKNIAVNQHKCITQMKSDNYQIIHLNYQFSFNDLFGISIGEDTSRSMNKEGIKQLHMWYEEDALKDKFKEMLIKDIINNHNNLTHSRLQEVMTLLLYLLLSKMIICVNCKSGCDRTSLAFGIVESLNQMIETRPDELDDIVYIIMHYDTINANIQSLNSNIHSYQDWNDKMDKIIDKNPSKGSYERRLLLTIELQNCIFNNLMNIGLPITVYSTGVLGLKYGKISNMLKNPHVSNALPQFIYSNTTLYNQSTFRRLMIGASNLRGADK